jgi:4-amino-4-deoxy-L-arabinose transferase-like glycosyltransferase
MYLCAKIMKKSWQSFLPYLCLGIFTITVWYFPLFYQLDRLYLTLWDESRLSVNAVEMLRSGDWFITTFQGQPDHWHTKPPLMIWLQVLSLKLLGINELAIRLPAALAGLATVGYIFNFIRRQTAEPFIAFAGSVLLLTANGFVGYHITRNGDTDALLCFFTTVMVLESYLFATTLQQKHFIIASIAVIGAIMTKGVQGLIFLPPVVLFVLGHRAVWAFLTKKVFWTMLLMVIAIPASYYFFRNQYDPGYWQAVVENELWGRFSKALEGHQHPFDYYFELMYKDLFFPHGYVGLASLVVLALPKNPFLKAGLYLIAVTLFYGLIISTARTKLEWYSAPVYPLWVVGIALVFLVRLKMWEHHQKYLMLCMAFGLGFLYQQKMRQIIDAKESDTPAILFGPYLKQVAQECKAITRMTAYTDDYTAAMLFYQARIQADNGKDFSIIRYAKDDLAKGSITIPVGEVISFRDDPMKPYIDSRYEYQELFHYERFYTVKITAKKSKDD